MTLEPFIQLDRLVLFEKIAPVGRATRRRVVIDDVTLAIPSDRYMLTGEEADRRCFIDLIIGKRDPVRGKIRHRGVCSYPIGRVAPFSVPVTGNDMVYFLAEVYGFDHIEAIRRLKNTLPWPRVLETRLDRAAAWQRLSLSIATAEFIDADIVLIDGVLSHPEFPDTFMLHIAAMLQHVVAGRLVVISTRHFRMLAPLATKSIQMVDGKLSISDNVVQPLSRPRQATAETPTADTEYDDDLGV